MEWIEPELIRVLCPAFANVFVRREPSKCFEALGEVVGSQKSGKVLPKLFVAVIVVAPDGCLF
jgi:hypothetical protein